MGAWGFAGTTILCPSEVPLRPLRPPSANGPLFQSPTTGGPATRALTAWLAGMVLGGCGQPPPTPLPEKHLPEPVLARMVAMGEVQGLLVRRQRPGEMASLLCCPQIDEACRALAETEARAQGLSLAIVASASRPAELAYLAGIPGVVSVRDLCMAPSSP